MMQQRAGDIKHILSGYDSGWFGQVWCALEVLHFFTIDGEVMQLTWPDVTAIQNPRYTNRRHLYPYFTLRVSKSLDLWCVLDRLSNFEKCNLRSGHLMWSGSVTFGVIGSSFSGNVPNCWLNSYDKFGGLCAAVFSLSAKKNWGGGGG